MSPLQINAFTARLEELVKDLGITNQDLPAMLFGAAVQAAVSAWGASNAARRTYLLALDIAAQAGLAGERPSTARH